MIEKIIDLDFTKTGVGQGQLKKTTISLNNILITPKGAFFNGVDSSILLNSTFFAKYPFSILLDYSPLSYNSIILSRNGHRYFNYLVDDYTFHRLSMEPNINDFGIFFSSINSQITELALNLEVRKNNDVTITKCKSKFVVSNASVFGDSTGFVFDTIGNSSDGIAHSPEPSNFHGWIKRLCFYRKL